MTRVTGPWTAEQAATFLDETTVPLRLATHRPDESLWTVPLWYRYREGSFECATWAEADVVRYLRNVSEVAFDVSVNRPPYRGVRGNGSANLSADREKALLEDPIELYLGGTDSELAAWLLDADREEVRIRVEPRRLHSWDYTERMGAAAE